ncbi:MAG TPA: T9SS type A sorting domain-containing protein [Chitinophagaceae bacterium]|nr:T9SS type A sorting domain-containing protein [Chitinophagaceae bacterium]
MKNPTSRQILLFAFSVFVFPFPISAQTMCNTVNEGQTLTLTAPAGRTFISITFASYGTPNGSCGSFTQGACHASNSLAIVQAALIGNNSGNIPATNGNFGDPCGGTFKRLYVEAVYSSGLPLKLLSFNGTVQGTANILSWETTDELNTQKFNIERNENVNTFSTIGSVIAANSPGNKHYSFTDHTLKAGTYFYRLKMIDQDGRFTYSKTIRLSNSRDSQILIFPNPVTALMTVSGLRIGGIIEMINLLGKAMLRMNVTAQTQTLDVSALPAGIYLVKYTGALGTTFQKVVKQ